MNSKNTTKVGICGHTIELNEGILHKLCLLSESEYMAQGLDKVIEFIIEIYKISCFENIIVNEEEAMTMLALISDVKKDYAFLSSLKIEEKSVFSEKAAKE